MNTDSITIILVAIPVIIGSITTSIVTIMNSRRQKETVVKLRGIEAQGDATHALVNSNYTEALRREEVALAATLALLRKSRDRDVIEGKASTTEENYVIQRAEAEVTESRRVLAQRGAAQAKLDSNIVQREAIAAGHEAKET